MKKIPTLYKKNPENLGLVTDEIDPQNLWVFKHQYIATRKYDGTSCMIKDGVLYKRYDAKIFKKKKGKVVKTYSIEEINSKLPPGAIPCQEEPDLITGHFPHWVICDRSDPSNKYHFEGFDDLLSQLDIVGNIYDKISDFNGTYELCGPKVQGNPEKFQEHVLVPHVSFNFSFEHSLDLTYEGLKPFLLNHDLEGIVFHEKSEIGGFKEEGKMCKIRKSDFGIKR